jgi:hypothetical protein
MRDLASEIEAKRLGRVPAMSAQAIGQVRALQDASAKLPQIPVRTEHVLHGGMYARTIYVPAGTLTCCCLVKVPTVVIVNGDCIVYAGVDKRLHLEGYNVMAGAAGRKQAFLASTDIQITMIFPTTATSVEEAENQFTDEHDELLSRQTPEFNHAVVTEEQKCLQPQP